MVRAHQDIHRWLSIGSSRDGLLSAIPPAQGLPWLRGRMLMTAFDLQSSRSLRTLHLRTRPAGSLVSLQLSRGSNDGASSPPNQAATAASRYANTDRPC